MNIKLAIDNGYCVGCGACAIIKGSPYKIAMNKYGLYQATIVSKTNKLPANVLENISNICPFCESVMNESSISKNLYASSNLYDEKIGYYLKNLVGRVVDNDFYTNSSSGGIGRWILYKLMKLKYVDYVIQVCNNSRENDYLFSYNVADTPEKVLFGSKSAYYPVEMSKVLKFIQAHPGKYAIIGIPCFIKSIRLLQKNNEIFNERIRFCIGIVCGHLKSSYYSEYIAWLMGISPGDLAKIDFRVKIPGRKANEKGLKVISKFGLQPKPEIIQNLYGTSYSFGLFKYKACDYCDDIIAETADVSVGDAWLPQFLNVGKSLVILRNNIISDVLDEGVLNNEISLLEISKEDVYASQKSSFMHKREGTLVRVKRKKKSKEWVPQKRFFKYVRTPSEQRKKIYLKREDLSSLSFEYFFDAKKKNSLEYFILKIKKEIDTYESLYEKNNDHIAVKIMKNLGLIGRYRKTKEFFKFLLK